MHMKPANWSKGQSFVRRARFYVFKLGRNLYQPQHSREKREGIVHQKKKKERKKMKIGNVAIGQGLLPIHHL